jgi:hypothetical protein
MFTRDWLHVCLSSRWDEGLCARVYIFTRDWLHVTLITRMRLGLVCACLGIYQAPNTHLEHKYRCLYMINKPYALKTWTFQKATRQKLQNSRTWRIAERKMDFICMCLRQKIHPKTTKRRLSEANKLLRTKKTLQHIKITQSDARSHSSETQTTVFNTTEFITE